MKIYLRVEVDVPGDYDINLNHLEDLLKVGHITDVTTGNKNDFEDIYMQHFNND